MIVPFAEYRPDVSDFSGAGDHTANILNVYPRGDGYGPVPRLQSYSSPMAAACRGYFFARKNDGSVQVFSGTSTKLYSMDNTALTFTDVSQGSSAYSALSADAHWQFAQFNKWVFATQQNAPLQAYSLTSSTEFADAAGSPPQAAYVSVVNRFLVLSGIIAPNVYRVQWSGLNDVSSSSAWTSGTNSSDYQDFADGGIVRATVGGEYGLIFQDSSIRRMTFAPGSPYVFGIDRIAQDDGLYAPYSVISAGERIYYISNDGFKKILPGQYPQSIGKERVDRFFFGDVDTGNLHMVIGVHDPSHTRVMWAYKSNNGATGLFDKVLCYEEALDKWSLIQISGEFIYSLARPGITLEGVDAAYGSNIDTLTISSLDDISSASIASLSAFDTTHKLGFFTGTNLEATLETGEQGADGRRVYINGVRPITDAASVSVAISARATQTSTPSYSTGTSPETDTGICSQRVSTRYARAKMTVTAATTWTFAAGVEPEIKLEGQR